MNGIPPRRKTWQNIEKAVGESNMFHIIEFIMQEDEIDPLVKAALAYDQSETIYPFDVGNSLVG